MLTPEWGKEKPNVLVLCLPTSLADSASLTCPPGYQLKSNSLLPGCGKRFPGNLISISLPKHKKAC